VQALQDLTSVHVGAAMDRDAVGRTLSDLISRGYAVRIYGHPEIRFQATESGRARILAHRRPETTPQQFAFREALILDALSKCEVAMTGATLMEIADPREIYKLTVEQVYSALESLLAQGLVLRVTQPDRFCQWSITTKGRARLIGQEAQAVFTERIPTEPIVAPCCRHHEPEEPATTVICLDEDELDEWWESLDVDMKGDCFAGFALKMYRGENNHTYIEPEHQSIPVRGTAGETAEEWKAKAERLNRAFGREENAGGLL
jgi:Fe2+ or Zn2+ uptake regulation protein